MACAAIPLKLMVPVPLVVSVPPLARLPPILIVLAPVEISRAALAVPAKVIEPVVVMAPVLTVTRETRAAAVPLVILMLAAVSAPEPTLRDFVLLPAVLLVEGFMVTAFVTFNAIAGPRFSVPLRVPPVNVTERAVELTLTVTVWGGLAAAMTTASAAPGTVAVGRPTHDQVAAELQLPVAMDVHVAAFAFTAPSNPTDDRSSTNDPVSLLMARPGILPAAHARTASVRIPPRILLILPSFVLWPSCISCIVGRICRLNSYCAIVTVICRST